MVTETATDSHAQNQMNSCKHGPRSRLQQETNKTVTSRHKWPFWRNGACVFLPPGTAFYMKGVGTLWPGCHTLIVKRKSSYLSALTCIPSYLCKVRNFQCGCLLLGTTAKHCAPQEQLLCFHRVPVLPKPCAPCRVPTGGILRAESQAHQSLTHVHMAVSVFLP